MIRRFAGDVGGVVPAAWVTVTVCPATVKVPERAAPVLLATV
jgi:hypothetical protein